MIRIAQQISKVVRMKVPFFGFLRIVSRSIGGLKGRSSSAPGYVETRRIRALYATMAARIWWRKSWLRIAKPR